MKEDEEYFEYKRRAKALFYDATGEAVQPGTTSTFILSNTMVKGMPKSVQQSLSHVVGLYTLTEEDFDKNCNHYVTLYRNERENNKEETQKVEVSNIKLQNKKLKEEVEAQKSKNKAANVMKVGVDGSQVNVEDNDQNQKGKEQAEQMVDVVKLLLTQRPAQRGYRGNSRGRSRGRGFQGQRGNRQISGDQCLICHQYGHWANTCPNKWYENPPRNQFNGRRRNQPQFSGPYNGQQQMWTPNDMPQPPPPPEQNMSMRGNSYTQYQDGPGGANSKRATHSTTGGVSQWWSSRCRRRSEDTYRYLLASSTDGSRAW
uniref:CCHC-type domain-containing protein n=1 Tax=Knipowitschia caucasica TaxID=637954 RepID=A0AAV2MFH6_KNICA